MYNQRQEANIIGLLSWLPATVPRHETDVVCDLWWALTTSQRRKVSWPLHLLQTKLKPFCRNYPALYTLPSQILQFPERRITGTGVLQPVLAREIMEPEQARGWELPIWSPWLAYRWLQTISAAHGEGEIELRAWKNSSWNPTNGLHSRSEIGQCTPLTTSRHTQEGAS